MVVNDFGIYVDVYIDDDDGEDDVLVVDADVDGYAQDGIE